MARNDVYLNINALSPADAVVTGQQDMTAATVPELVLGDTPTFNFYFTDNTNVWPSWAGNASYSLTWALSDAVAGDFAPAATTGNATPITGGWSVVLPLNSYDLVGLLNTKRVGQPYPVTNLWQQLRVTDPSGNEITRAMFWTPVRYRAISDTQNTESASPTGGRFVTVNNVNTLTTPTAAQFYSANPVPTSALGTAANGELLIGNGTGFTKSTLTAGTGITVTNGSGSITIDASGAQETLTATVKNAESVAITKGQVVYLFGATGGFASVKLAYNTSDATSAKTFGVVSSTSIAANGTGTVTCVGVVDGLNLGAYNDGDTLYLGATPGSVTATKPYAPNHLVYVGIVERANNGNGELYVRVQNGYELDEIHDVQISAPKLAGQTLIYDQTNDLWKNARLTGTANQITVTNADAAVTLSIPTNPTLPGNLTVSGTGNSSIAGNLLFPVNKYVYFDGSGAAQTATIGVPTGTNDLNIGNNNALLVLERVSGESYFKVGGTEKLRVGASATTLAGNLTVNGTGGVQLNSVANLTWGGSYGAGIPTIAIPSATSIGFYPTGSTSGKTFELFGTGNATLTGNLTVSGTGTHSFNGPVSITGTTASNLLRLTKSGAGSKTFGIDNALDFRIYADNGSTQLFKLTDSGDTTITGNLTVSGGTISSGTASLTLKSTASTVILQSAGTTALTLDSSQNATFAGRVATGGAASIGVAVSTGLGLNVNLDPGTLTYGAANAWLGARIRPARAGTTGNAFAISGQLEVTSGTQTKAATIIAEAPSGTLTNHTYFYANSSGSRVAPTGNYSLYAESTAGPAYIGDATASTSTTTGALQVAGGVGVAGAVNVGGAISIGNTVQTAASVASTHKVTISIGGSTYYLLATNV